MLRLVVFLALATGFMACRSDASASDSKEKFSAEEAGNQQKAWDDMMAVHDRIMPAVMNDLPELSKDVDALRVSDSADLNGLLDKVNVLIEQADKGMYDWMEEVKNNPLDSLRSRYPDHQAIMSYIDKELTDIQSVESTIAEAKEKILLAAKMTGKVKEIQGN